MYYFNQIVKFQEEQKLIQFLMGLNESYVIVRGNMLMMNPLPTMPQVYTLFVQEERQGRLMPIYILVVIILFFWHLVTKVK